MAQIRSRILQYMPKELLVSLNDICYDVTIPDNNTKVNMMVSVLDKYDIDYIELGPGTNRFAVLIDGYVFKIAMDRYGIKDNWAEFAIAKELQPYVTKTYECNGLIVVAEYVTVISKDEFIEKKENIRTILSYLAQGYLMGDVGSISKNFMNWGYRDDGQLVILDFAYIYRIKGDEMICGGLNSDGEQCMEFLEYDENFNKLTCPKCRKTYTFYDIRKKIDSEYEKKEVELSKQMAYQTTEANTPIGEQVVFKTEPITKSDIYGKDDEDMYGENVNEYKNEISNEELEDMYEALLDKLPSVSACDETIVDNEPVEEEERLTIDMCDVLETAEEFAEDLDGEEDEQHGSRTTSDYYVMRESIIGGVSDDDGDDEYYTDPDEIEYTSEDDEEMPVTISETVTAAITEEIGDILDDVEEALDDDTISEDECGDTQSSSLTFIDVDEESEEEIESDDEEFTDVEAEINDEVDTCENSEEMDEDPEVKYTIEADINDEVSEEDSFEKDTTESEQTSFIQFIDADNDCDDIESMRRSLRSDIPTDDELDAMYDDAVMENQKYRYSSKKGRNE